MAAPVPLIFQEALNVSPTMVEAFQSHKLLPYKARSNLSSIGAMTVAFCVVVRWCWRDGFYRFNREEEGNETIIVIFKIDSCFCLKMSAVFRHSFLSVVGLVVLRKTGPNLIFFDRATQLN